MLILTRSNSEKIIINDNIIITILDIKNHTVKIGFDGPREIEIHRYEIYNRILQEKKEGKFFEFRNKDQGSYLKSILNEK